MHGAILLNRPSRFQKFLRIWDADLNFQELDNVVYAPVCLKFPSLTVSDTNEQKSRDRGQFSFAVIKKMAFRANLRSKASHPRPQGVIAGPQKAPQNNFWAETEKTLRKYRGSI